MSADEADSLVGKIARVLDEVRDDLCGFDAEEMSSAVLPLVAVEVRKAKAEALREAAREEFQFSPNVHYQGIRAHERLVKRADRIETGDQR